MAFTMRYGGTSPPVRAETSPKAAASKKPARGRKHGTLQSQAQALFAPTQAQPSEAAPPDIMSRDTKEE